LVAAGCSRGRSGQGSGSALSVGPADTDLEKLQGTWRIESSIWNGVQEPEIAKSVIIHFEGDKFFVVDKDGNRVEERIKLMGDQYPKAIDRTSQEDSQPAPGIYSLEGDTLQWCSAGGGNRTRPTTFSSRPGSKQSLMVLRRDKSGTSLAAGRKPRLQ
jgi:uncharacterized protein (TIGR03067 family)